MSAFGVTDDRPLIYIAGGLTRADHRRLQVYGDIRKGCSRAGFDSYLPHEDLGSRQDNLDPVLVFEAKQSGTSTAASRSLLKYPMHRTEWESEIQHAFDRQMPVVAIADRSCRRLAYAPWPSWAIRGCAPLRST